MSLFLSEVQLGPFYTCPLLSIVPLLFSVEYGVVQQILSSNFELVGLCKLLQGYRL